MFRFSINEKTYKEIYTYFIRDTLENIEKLKREKESINLKRNNYNICRLVYLWERKT